MFRDIFNTKTFYSDQKEINCLSVKELYILYIVLFNNKFIRCDFNTFCAYNYFLLKNYNFVLYDIDHVFLITFFTSKTKSVLLVKPLTNNFVDNKHLFRSKNTKPNFSKFNTFWKKWKNLKRPKTEDNFDEYFLKDWKIKFKIYSKIGFLKIYDDFFAICVNSKKFYKNTVLISKPLLISPKYSSSSINKYITVGNSQNFEFQFLRKNKVYNKGRYSRCRQNYRTGVYMCMYLSVVSIFGLYYWFYKFSFNFTYLWWVFIAFLGSFFLPKIFKYRLYEPNVLLTKFFDFFRWVFLVIKSLFF